MVPAVNGAVVYTDVDPDQTFSNNFDSYELDLNNDGNPDFTIRLNKSSSSQTGFKFWNNNIAIQALSANQVFRVASTVTTSQGGTFVSYFANAMNQSSTVNSNLDWGSFNQNMGLSYYWAFGSQINSGSRGPWLNVTDKYLGLKLRVGNMSYYGWARLDMPSGANRFTIKDYAYEDLADEPIVTGVVPNMASQVQSVIASDADDNSNASDIEVVFTKGDDESTIDEYRAIVVKAAEADKLSTGIASGLSAARYSAIPKTGSNITTMLDATLLDADGNAITNGIEYKVFVLSVADGVKATANALSGASNEFKLTAPASTVSSLIARDIAEHGNGRDLQLVFHKADDETTVASYRILVVKAEKSTSFDLAAAENVDPADYTAIPKTGSHVMHILDSVSTDTDGELIRNDIAYRVFILSLADGVKSLVNGLSNASNEIILTTHPAAIEEGSLQGIRLFSQGHHIYLDQSQNPGEPYRDIRVLDLSGRQIYRNPNIGQQEIIRLDQVENGMFVVQLIRPDRSVSRKIWISTY